MNFITQKSNTKSFYNLKSRYIALFVLFLSILIVSNGLLLYTNNEYIDGYSYINRLLGLVGWFLLICSIWTWNKMRKELISAYTIFLVITYLFTFGQSLLDSFYLLPEKIYPNLTVIANYTELQIFTLLGLCCLHIGALITCSEKINEDEDKTNIGLAKAVRITGIILCAITVPAFLYEIITILQQVIKGGYVSLFNYGSYSGFRVSEGMSFGRIFGFLGGYFIPALICIIIANESLGKSNKVAKSTLLIYILINLFIGKRETAMTLVIILVIINLIKSVGVNYRKVIKMLVLAYLLLTLAVIVGDIRDITDRSFNTYMDTILSSFGENNIIIAAIAGFGGSMHPLALVMDIIPNDLPFAYYYGTTYLASFMTLIPNLGFWEIHPVMIYGEGQEWLKTVSGLSYGPGFNIMAEGYRNFGGVGYLILIIWGLLFGKITSLIEKRVLYRRPDLLWSIIVFFNMAILISRKDFFNLVRPLFYIIIPIFVMIHIIYYFGLKKSQKI